METGNKIKRIAILFFCVTLIAFICGGVLLAVVVHNMVRNAANIIAAIGTFVGITGIGLLLAWIEKTLISGFGELVENTAAIRKSIESQRDVIKPIIESPAQPRIQNLQSEQTEVKAQEVDAVRPIPVEETKIRCPKCNAEQPANRSKCWECGVKFIHE